MNSYLPCLLVALAVVPLYAAPTTPMNMTYYMENVGTYQGKCGKAWTLPINMKYNYELVSHGRAVDGDCTTTITVGHSSKCTRKVCVRLDEWTLDADVMNLTLKGEMEEKVLKKGQEQLSETCFEGISLVVRVMEDEEYALKWANNEVPSQVYSFRMAVFPDCPGYPKGLVEKSDKDSADYNKAGEYEEATTMNIVYGVIVALLICSVFLVVLLITYCYYKNNPQGRKRRTVQKQSKLEETFMKEKKNVGEQVAKDKRVEGQYKKTDNTELEPLVSAAAPAAAAVVTQDDHGSPTIQISEAPADNEEKGEE